MGYREVGARQQRAERSDQKQGTVEDPTDTATKVLQGPWFVQSLSHNLIRAKEIAKVAFERHSMVRS